MLIRDAGHAGRRVDLRIDNHRIVEIADRIVPRSNEIQVPARGGEILPGLHDHHIHLFSLAASLDSIDCRPEKTPDTQALRKAIRAAPASPDGLRGWGYFESVAGLLDRKLLDELCPDRPLRIQHRNGAMWFLNSSAIDLLGLDTLPTPVGVYRDSSGRSTGHVFRLDAWMRARLPRRVPLDLGRVGKLLARRGVTSVTDATATNGLHEAKLFRDAQRSGALPQRLHLMGSLELAGFESTPDLSVGPVKLLLDEPALPDLDVLTESIQRAHAMQRPVAIHCVTRCEIHFAIAAIEAAGPIHGDRLEHASVAPPEALEAIQRLRLTVVTQPNFVMERGDAYLRDVETLDLPYLYRLRAWVEAGVALAAGTDAPFGEPDAWQAMRAAIDRRSRSKQPLGPAEALSPEQALALFSGQAANPGRASRSIRVGTHADLCLLDSPWRDARYALESGRVAATIRGEHLLWARSDRS